MAQAHEVYYLTYRETDLGSPITLYLQVPTYKSTSSICKAVVQYLASYTSSEDCTNVQASETTTSWAEMVMDVPSAPC